MPHCTGAVNRGTLLPDYRDDGEPKVGFFDFDNIGDFSEENWEDQAQFWDSFDVFFDELYCSDED